VMIAAEGLVDSAEAVREAAVRVEIFEAGM
jgi:hypothetical protein